MYNNNIMTLFLNQIFYPCSPINTIDSLKRLDAFILKKNGINRINDSAASETEVPLILSNDSLPTITLTPPNLTLTPLNPAPTPPNTTLAPNLTLTPPNLTLTIPPQTLATTLRPSIDFIQTTPPLASLFPKKIFYPRREDSLFWCMFISHHGFPEHYLLGSKYANREMEEKQRIMDTFRKTPALLKETNYKVTNVLTQEILSDLLVNKKSSLSTLLALVVFYKKKVFLTTEHTYLYYSYDKNGDIPLRDKELEDALIIHWDAETKLYGLDQEVTSTKVHGIHGSKIRLEHMNKPLKGVSTYKMGELHHFARVLHIPPEDYEKAKKQELYEMIFQKCLRI